MARANGVRSLNADAVFYRGFRYPAEIISHCVWLYYRFPLSLRDVQEMMAERGVIVSYESIHQWCRKFGQSFANGLRRRRPRPGDKRHLDEHLIEVPLAIHRSNPGAPRRSGFPSTPSWIRNSTRSHREPAERIFSGDPYIPGQSASGSALVASPLHGGPEPLLSALFAGVIHRADLGPGPALVSHLDHRGDEPQDYGFCVFGEVIEGLEVLEKISAVEVEDKDDFKKIPVETVLIESAYRMR